MKSIEEQNVELMLDSGAFSAWSRGIEIPLQEYADFILKHPKAFDIVVGLDVIPGKVGVSAVPDSERERAAVAGWENWKALTALLKPIGVIPMHVFHQGENIKWLRRLMDEAEYFGVSPQNGIPEKQRWLWLDQIMPTLCDTKGRPLRKFHGFGVTSLETMLRYPWYSVDSTSWVMTGRFGAAFIPLGNILDPAATHKVTFSSDSPEKNREGKHYSTYSRIEREAIAAYLAQQGMTPQMLEKNFCLSCGTEFRAFKTEEPLTCCVGPDPNVAYIRRDQINIDYFLEVERALQDPRVWRRESAPVGLGF